ncbi:MAG: glycine zipper 2TM domain-containing protein [Dyella sp.]
MSSYAWVTRGMVMGAMVAAVAGCATQPYGQSAAYAPQRVEYSSRGNCQTCGVVQSVQQVYVDGRSDSGILGAVIGAVAGGVLGSTIGKGDGRTAATVGGAVAGGVVGNRVGQRGGQDVAFQIGIKLDNGQYATVTQRADPQVRSGDYVQIRGDQVYRL